MKKVAKVVLIDEENNYLMMRRSAHPEFPNDPDLPGGTVEINETSLQAAIREVDEEASITLTHEGAVEKYSGTDYSSHGTKYYLYEIHLAQRPEVTISWEHSSYEWLDATEFLSQSRAAADTYMHMVYDTMK